MPDVSEAAWFIVVRPLLVDVGLKFERAEMQMIRWMCGIFMKDRRTHA